MKNYTDTQILNFLIKRGARCAKYDIWWEIDIGSHWQKGKTLRVAADRIMQEFYEDRPRALKELRERARYSLK